MNALPARKMITDPATMTDEDITRVAVLMPAYNPGDSINKTVESLVKNT